MPPPSGAAVFPKCRWHPTLRSGPKDETMCAASADPSSASPAGYPAIKSANWIAADYADGRIMVWLMHEGEARQQVSAQSSGELMADVTAVISELRDCPARPPMVKIIGICAPRNACASTRMTTLRLAMRSSGRGRLSVMTDAYP